MSQRSNKPHFPLALVCAGVQKVGGDEAWRRGGASAAGSGTDQQPALLRQLRARENCGFVWKRLTGVVHRQPTSNQLNTLLHCVGEVQRVQTRSSQGPSAEWSSQSTQVQVRRTRARAPAGSLTCWRSLLSSAGWLERWATTRSSVEPSAAPSRRWWTEELSPAASGDHSNSATTWQGTGIV